LAGEVLTLCRRIRAVDDAGGRVVRVRAQGRAADAGHEWVGAWPADGLLRDGRSALADRRLRVVRGACVTGRGQNRDPVLGRADECTTELLQRLRGSERFFGRP